MQSMNRGDRFLHSIEENNEVEKQQPSYTIVIDTKKILAMFAGVAMIVMAGSIGNRAQPTQVQPVSEVPSRKLENTMSTYYDPRSDAAPPCLEFGSSFDKVVSEANQVFLLMPPKGGGLSLEGFTNMCFPPKNLGFAESIFTPLTEDHRFMHAEIPELLTGHVDRIDVLTHIMNSIPKDALVILMYREESSRKTSAAKFVATERLCGGLREPFPGLGPTGLPEYDNHPLVYPGDVGVYRENGKCIIGDEQAFIQKVMVERYIEVGSEMNHLMSCPFHEALKNNFPNFILVNYKQADGVQMALAKRFCPQIMPVLPLHVNVSGEKDDKEVPYIKVKETGDVIELAEWAESKRMFFDWALHWEKGQDDYVSCQADTRFYENTLLTCKDEAIRLSGF